MDKHSSPAMHLKSSAFFSGEILYIGGQPLATSSCVASGNHWQYADNKTARGGKEKIKLNGSTANLSQAKHIKILTLIISFPHREKGISAVNSL